MIRNDFTITVNMPDCSNRVFYIVDDFIIKSKKVSFEKSKNNIFYHNLTVEFQYKIASFLNPKAICLYGQLN